MHRLVLAVFLLLAACSPPEEAPAPATCEAACAVNQECVDGACACTAGSTDCDGDMSNGCEPESTCFCAYEGDEAFCERHQASCGQLAAADNCGNWRLATCGTCADGETCGAEVANHCGVGECRAESLEGICDRLDWRCGKSFGTDRCGVRHDVDCGGCQPYHECTARRECVPSGLLPYDVCGQNRQFTGRCADGLECSFALDGSLAVCLPLCSKHEDCPVGQRCSLGYFASGGGICGDLRDWGEQCQSEFEGPSFCWDLELGNTVYMTCLSQRCNYICEIEGNPQEYFCPETMDCGADWLNVGTTTRVRVCGQP